MEEVAMLSTVRIFLDGIIIFVIQKYFERSLGKKKAKEDVLEKLYKTFFDKITEILYYIYTEIETKFTMYDVTRRIIFPTYGT